MTAYFTDPMGDEFKKALEKVLKKGKISAGEDPDAVKRSRESKNARARAPKRRQRKQRFSKEEAKKLR